jgi:hypothetical protein
MADQPCLGIHRLDDALQEMTRSCERKGLRLTDFPQAVLRSVEIIDDAYGMENHIE